jgi:hypothetical protein
VLKLIERPDGSDHPVPPTTVQEDLVPPIVAVDRDLRYGQFDVEVQNDF